MKTLIGICACLLAAVLQLCADTNQCGPKVWEHNSLRFRVPGSHYCTYALVYHASSEFSRPDGGPSQPYYSLVILGEHCYDPKAPFFFQTFDPSQLAAEEAKLCPNGFSQSIAHAKVAAASSMPVGHASQSDFTGDFNGDGNLDVAYLDPASGLVIQLIGADGSVISNKTFPVGFTPTDSNLIAGGDFDGDGKPDLAVSYYNSAGTGGAAILLGNGDGTFGAPKLTPSASGYPQFLAAADFNGDGHMDLVLSNTSFSGAGAAMVSVLLGTGDGTFSAPTTYSAGQGGVPDSILAVDLNGDGAPDIVTANVPTSNASGNVSVLLNTAGKFGPPIVTSVPCQPSYLTFADYNHDGKLDLIAGCARVGTVVVLYGNGNGTFQAPLSYAVGAYPSSIAVAPLMDGNTLLFSGDGSVSTDNLMTVVSPQGVPDAPLVNFVGGQPTGIAAGDLNGDGQPDVVVTGTSSDVAVMISQGGTQFKAPVGYSLGQPSPQPQAVAVGDLNGDGKKDVVVASSGNGAGGSVSVLLGNGDGTLQAPMNTAVNGYAQSIALGDFNHDGKLDVAVAAHGTPLGGSGPDAGAVVVLLGKGDGTFQTPVTLTVSGYHPAAVAAADLNGDGNLDLAVAMDSGTSQQAGTLAIFLGQNNGTFAAARTFPLQGTLNLSLAIGDLNGDGKPDIVVASGFTQKADVMLGDGKGGFSEAATLPVTDPASTAVAIMDLDHDGKLDLVFTECCGQTESYYMLGNGDGTFLPVQHFSSGASTTALAVTRFSGSSGPDLVIAQQGGSWISLVNAVSGGATGPAPGSAAPPSGSGTGGTFTFTFSDSGGYQNLNVVDVLINSALDGRHACYLAFVQSSGSLYLVDDAGDAGGPYQGLVLPGGGSISNGQCTVNGAGSSASGSGNNLTLTLAITFSSSFHGNQVFYLSAGDSSANSGWQALGTWGVPGAAVSGPSVTGMSPGRTTSLGPTAYTFTFADTNGWQDIEVANILINSAIDGRHGCYLAFVPATNSVLLVDDAGDAGGPYSGMVLPGTGTVSNSQCSVSGVGSSVSGSGNTLTLTLSVTFTQSFAGNQIFFLAARNNTLNSNWQAVGSVSVP